MADPPGVEDVIAVYGGGPPVFFPHYWSTYCIHGLHNDCRLTCKTCKAPCLCPCHDEDTDEENHGQA